MPTEVRHTSSNNAGLWIVLAVVAVIAIIAIFVIANNGRNAIPPVAQQVPSTSTIVTDTGAGSDAAARSAQSAADSAAASATEAAREARAATTPPAPGVTATVPGPGDSSVTITTPPAR
jgi:hypothetical protein